MKTKYYSDQILRIHQVKDCEFTWGGVRNALLLECQDQNTNQIQELCKTDLKPVKEMMVVVLCEYGKEDPEFVFPILDKLLKANKRSEREKERQLMGVENQEYYAPRRIAIEVASVLGGEKGIEILINAMKDPSSNVRSDAVRYAYYLLRQDNNQGSMLLNEVANLSLYHVGIYIPNFKILMAYIELTFLILFNLDEQTDIDKRKVFIPMVHEAWKGIITHLFVGKNSISRGISKIILERIVGVVSGLTSELPRYNSANLDEIGYFFNLSEEKKASYKKLVSYLTDSQIDLEKAKPEFLDVIRRNDSISWFVLGRILIQQGIIQPDLVLELVKELWEEEKRIWPNGLALAQIPYILYVIQRHRNVFDQTYTDLIHQYQSEFINKTKGVFKSSSGASYVTIGIDTRLICDYEISHKIEIDEDVKDYIESAKEARSLQKQHEGAKNKENKENSLENFIHNFKSWFQNHLRKNKKNNKFDESECKFLIDIIWYLSTLHNEYRYHGILLENLKPLFNCNDNKEVDKVCDDEVQSMVIDLLARMRYSHPDEIDGYMVENQFSLELVNRIISAERNETIGGDMIWSNGPFGFGDKFIMMIQSPDLRSHLVNVLNKAAEIKTMKAWLIYAVKEITNMIYGQTIYNVE